MSELKSVSNSVQVSTGSSTYVLPSVPTAPTGALFYDDFSSGDFSHKENGFRWGATKNADVSAEFPKIGSHSLRIKYPKENSNGYSFAEKKLLFPSDSYKELWIKWYMYLPDGTEGIGPKWEHTPNSTGNSSNNKYFLLYGNGRGSGAGSDWFLAAVEGDPQNDKRSKTKWNYRGTVDDDSTTYNHHNCLPKDDYTFTAGSWVEFKVHCKLASFSNGTANRDGKLHVWINGSHRYGDDNVGTIDCNGRRVRLSSITEAKNWLEHCYFMGWCNGGFEQATDVFIDQVSIASSEADL